MQTSTETTEVEEIEAKIFEFFRRLINWVIEMFKRTNLKKTRRLVREVSYLKDHFNANNPESINAVCQQAQFLLGMYCIFLQSRNRGFERDANIHKEVGNVLWNVQFALNGVPEEHTSDNLKIAQQNFNKSMENLTAYQLTWAFTKN